jgi:hypothetical protein
MASSPEQARKKRESVFLTAHVRVFGGEEASTHRARNLSETSVCLDQAESLTAGQTVLIKIGLLDDVGASVIWSEKGLAGLRFAQPINPDAAKRRPKPLHVEQGWG